MREPRPGGGGGGGGAHDYPHRPVALFRTNLSEGLHPKGVSMPRWVHQGGAAAMYVCMYVCKDSAAPAHARTRAHKPAAPRQSSRVSQTPSPTACPQAGIPHITPYVAPVCVADQKGGGGDGSGGGPDLQNLKHTMGGPIHLPSLIASFSCLGNICPRGSGPRCQHTAGGNTKEERQLLEA